MRLLFILFLCVGVSWSSVARSQDLQTNINANKQQRDSLRKAMDSEKDSLVYTAKFIRYTSLKLTRDSTITLPLDTSLTGIQNFSVIAQPRKPTIGLGNLGIAVTPLLFEPVKTIGFDAGFHALDPYALNPEDIFFYRARTPFTRLYYVNGGQREQVFQVLHTQNIKKNWNIGAQYERIGANGEYARQRGDHLNGVVFSWYESPNKRYNLMANAIFNTMKAAENGSIQNETIFETEGDRIVTKEAEPVRLLKSSQLWRKNSFMMRQSYFVGRIDTTSADQTQNILPTNKIVHTISYTNQAFSFKKDDADTYHVFPEATLADATFTNDSTYVKHLKNEFVYSFFLRAKGDMIKNELKIDAGIRHDFYRYRQAVLKADGSPFFSEGASFQNIALLGGLGYRFSNKVDLNVQLQQLFQGRNAGDFLYEAKSNFSLSEKTGVITLGAYLQNKSPEELFLKYTGNHHQWDYRDQFDRTKVMNLSFNYLNNYLKLDASAAYFMVTNYLYFDAGNLAGEVTPMQAGGDVHLLKISVGKKFTFGSFTLDSYVVYQKTANNAILRMPEVYTFNSFYKDQTFAKVLKTQIGFDIRYHTPIKALSYAPAVSQFYNGSDVTFGTKPIADVWVKAGLRRANLFVKYDFVNQGLFNRGYYTIDRYPMPGRGFKFGVTWNFYD